MDILGFSETTKATLIIIAGIGFAVYGGYNLTQQSAALENAKPVNVTIESTGIEDVSQRRGVDYRPDVSFSYTFEGEDYTSNNVYPAGVAKDFNTHEDAEDIIQKYNTGEQAEGFINPESPGKAFLKDESSNSPYMMIFIGMAMALISTVSKFRG